MAKILAISVGILVILMLISYVFMRKKPSLAPLPVESDMIVASSRGERLDQQSSAHATNRPASASTVELQPKQVDAAAADQELPSAAPAETATLEERLAASETATPPAQPPPSFDIKKFAIDAVLAMPVEEKKKFLDKNKLVQPENFERFRYLQELSVIDRFLKGRYQGKIESSGWIIALTIDGQLEDGHFQGELALELANADNFPISRSTTSGPLDSHVRIVEEGDHNSLLILPSSRGQASMYQIFIGEHNRSTLAGNYYQRNEDGKYEWLGPFVLKRI